MRALFHDARVLSKLIGRPTTPWREILRGKPSANQRLKFGQPNIARRMSKDLRIRKENGILGARDDRLDLRSTPFAM